MYTLTSIEPTIACFGTSYQTIAAAKNEAVKLQQLGLCEIYSVGKMSYDEGHHEVYRSKPENCEHNY